MPIERLQALDQPGETLQRLILAGVMFALVGAREIFRVLDVLNTYQLVSNSPLPNYVFSSYIVCDSIDPGSERASLVKYGEAAPKT